MKVFIAGGSGFVGSHMTTFLVDKGIHVSHSEVFAECGLYVQVQCHRGGVA
jgi:UDP-glucose 4-epimerase